MGTSEKADGGQEWASPGPRSGSNGACGRALCLWTSRLSWGITRHGNRLWAREEERGFGGKPSIFPPQLTTATVEEAVKL
jgi:hypothetical protein